MTDYQPPIADIEFVLTHLVGLDDLCERELYAHVDSATVRAVLSEVGRFLADVVAPTNRDGDQIGSVHHPDGTVTTPPGFKEAYAAYVASGFGTIPFDPTYGGGGFPWVSAVAIQEMLTSSNMSFSLCPLLTQGAIDAIEHWGDDEQKATFLPKMMTGEWSGTMNLTEPHAGSDVGALTSKAEPNGDGSWRISGQKIFITFGEHDMAENIIHLVLARTPGAPPGTKGISLFVVPKFLVNPDGSLGERNDVTCVSIEHKVGIHGSPTCVLSYGENGGATGWLVGPENGGMRAMFTMMNNARLSVGLEGHALAERAFQQALQYSQDRTQGTAIGAPKGTSSPIIDHPDVRRMLMTQRSWIDALRYLIYANAGHLDRARASDDAADREHHSQIADLYIPLSKGLGTDLGVELTSLAVQIHGGMGYVTETGVDQHWRDARIAPIYEGTNGIQAADLVGRKLPMGGGQVVADELARCTELGRQCESVAELGDLGANLVSAAAAATEASVWLGGCLVEGRVNDALAGSSPYLRLLGTVVCGGLHAQAALAALAADDLDADFVAAKVASARFFGRQVLPTVTGLVPAVTAGADDLFALSAAQLG